jgi:hypothetical protein
VSRAPVRRGVVDVEEMPCPRGGLHVLRNSSQRGGLVTACVGCGLSWAELDTLARGSERPLGPCEECGRKLMRRREWAAATDAQRAAWAAEGFTVQNAPGRCHCCYQRAHKRIRRAARKAS